MDKENVGVLTPRNRIISETTGLVKLQLSPLRNAPQVSPARSKGLKVSVPIVEQSKEPAAPTKSDLLAKYASKQAKLMELEKQAEVLRFELMELQAQLHLEINKDRPLETIKTRANEEVNMLKKKVSTIFLANWPNISPETNENDKVEIEASEIGANGSSHQSPHRSPYRSPERSLNMSSNGSPEKTPHRSGGLFPPPELTKKASSMFSANQQFMKKKASTIFNNQETMKKASTIFSNNQELVKKKASTMFNNKFLSEVRDRMDQQQAELDKIAKKGSDFAKDFFTSLSPKKEKVAVGVDSSFVFENVENTSMDHDNDILTHSILLSEDDTVEQVDIDDYSSSEE
ncbi:CIC11C00000002639 [Sungouiella intermedia]|uniref:CIC11C00000002639 n=1 Tax=Sungouiella intermedia TaxID=45354 RepID=A0A1L0GHJ0_9ASCO|nr:CIC11C00000002639 [[Candida] intermedia]